MKTKEFLEMLYGDVLDELYFCIFTMPGNHARFFMDIDEAAAYIDSLERVNAYYSVGMMRKVPKKGRGGKDDVSALIGLWADIDIKSAAKDESLPKTVDEAFQALEKFLPAPTVTVHTGHGIHPLWLFKEPWVFDNEQEKKEAINLVGAWIATIQLHWSRQGWKADPVKDISRVLRLPNTWNIGKKDKLTGKPLKPVRTSVYQVSGIKYNPSDMWQYVVEDAEKQLAQQVQVTGSINVVLDPNAQPPMDKFAKLMNNDKFRELWSFSDPVKGNDLNRYDQGLTNIAVANGWTDQEIADLLIAFRRQNAPGNDKAYTRPDYIERTIKKARASFQRQSALENLEETAATAESIDEITDEEQRQAAREQVLEQLNYLLGFRIKRMIRYDMDEPQFRLETAKHSFMLGGADVLLKYDRFMTKVYAHTGHQIDHFKPKEWREVSKLFPAIWETISAGEEATEEGMITSWLQDYLLDQEPERDETMIDDAIARKAPVERDGKVYIFVSEFRRWLATTQAEKISAKELGILLRTVGCETRVLSYVNPRTQKRTTRNAWEVPGHLL